MLNPQNFRTTTTENLTSDQLLMKNEFSIQYISDDKGEDWYDLVKLFQDDTLKIQYDMSGMTIAADRDGSKLFPIGCSVIELADSSIPADFTPGNYTYAGGVLLPVPIDYVAIATRRRDNLMGKVSTRITALTEAQDDEDITDTEKAQLAALREYRIRLRRLDLSKAPDVEWPDIPILFMP